MHRVIINMVSHYSNTVSDDNFFKKSPCHQFQAIYYSVIIKSVFLIKLVQKILRPFNWPCHQLRIKQYIQGKNSEVTLRFLMRAIDFNCIAHCLERMKREPDGK